MALKEQHCVLSLHTERLYAIVSMPNIHASRCCVLQVLMSIARAKELGCTPLARILSYADAARDPVEFTIAPSDAVPLALKRAGLSTDDCDYHEINEAFAVVALANMQRLKLDHAKVNVNGGAVALGHPLG
jgi:acetyl-CoA C-acetyltransferase